MMLKYVIHLDQNLKYTKCVSKGSCTKCHANVCLFCQLCSTTCLATSTIQLVAVANSSVVEDIRVDAVLKPLINDIKELERVKLHSNRGWTQQ